MCLEEKKAHQKYSMNSRTTNFKVGTDLDLQNFNAVSTSVGTVQLKSFGH